MKLITTPEYLLFIYKEAEIKPNKYALNIASKEVYKTSYSYRNLDKITGASPVVAYHPLTKEAKELDLPLLPPFEENFTKLNKLIKEEQEFWYNKTGSKTATEIVESCISIGYKAAQSKQFSLEDIISFASFCNDNHSLDDSGGQWNWQPLFSNVKPKINQQMFEDWKQSLSTQQLPKEFIPEEKSVEDIQKELGIYGHDEGLTESEYNEYLKTNSIYKTIINSEGKEELVGSYTY